MAKYNRKIYSYKGYKIKENLETGGFDIFKPSWDPNYPVFEELPDLEHAKVWIESDKKSDDEERIMKENAVRNYAQRFKIICEYNFNTRLEEEGEGDPNADPNAAPPADPNAAPPADAGVEGDPNAAPPADPNAAPPTDAGVEGDPNAMPMEGEGDFEDVEMDEGGLQPDDNVIDVSEITGNQEQTNSEMEELKSKFEQLVQLNDRVTQTLEKLAQSAESSQSAIQSVKDDLAQRVPTEIEKLQARPTQSGPFEHTVEDYWKNRPGGDKYDIYPDTEEDGEPEYVLRKSDIENINPQSVYNSFNQKLRDIINF